MPQWACVNGTLMPAAEARVSVFDAGFQPHPVLKASIERAHPRLIPPHELPIDPYSLTHERDCMGMAPSPHFGTEVDMS